MLEIIERKTSSKFRRIHTILSFVRQLLLFVRLFDLGEFSNDLLTNFRRIARNSRGVANGIGRIFTQITEIRRKRHRKSTDSTRVFEIRDVNALRRLLIEGQSMSILRKRGSGNDRLSHRIEIALHRFCGILEDLMSASKTSDLVSETIASIRLQAVVNGSVGNGRIQVEIIGFRSFTTKKKRTSRIYDDWTQFDRLFQVKEGSDM